MSNRSFDQTIDLFCDLGKEIPGVYDLLIRGTFSAQQWDVSDWSDLDFTVIVKEMSLDVHHKLNKMYQKLSHGNDLKISITCVDLEDLLSSTHYHGLKPLYYSSRLHEARSILIGESLYLSKPLIFDLRMQLDCYTNMAYLMHDLRMQHMKLNDTLSSMAVFCKHLAKRVKHMLRNAIYIKSGWIGEQINPNLLEKHFQTVDKRIIEELHDLKAHWSSIQGDRSKLLDSIDYFLNNAEITYKDISVFVNKLHTRLKVKNDDI